MSDETAVTTPGRAAYEAWNGGAENVDYSDVVWENSAPAFHARWAAAAESARADLLAERDSLTGRVAELVTEGNELRALVGEILTVFEPHCNDPECPWHVSHDIDQESIDGWHKRATLTPPANTDGGGDA